MQHPGTWERRAGLSGILAVGTVLAGIVVLSRTDEPGDTSTPQQVLEYYRGATDSIFASSILMTLGLLLFVVFLAALRNRLHAAEGGNGPLSTVVFGGGIAAVILLFGTMLPNLSGAIAVLDDRSTLTPEAAQALAHLGSGFYLGAFMTTSIPLAATAIAVLRTGVLPRWFGWVTAVLAVGMVVPFVDWLLFGLVFPIWVIITSLLLARGGTAIAAAPTREAVVA
jgi:hypothetical protein